MVMSFKDGLGRAKVTKLRESSFAGQSPQCRARVLHLINALAKPMIEIIQGPAKQKALN
jgi:hypothetical protein